jgi:hypothetical protein
MVLAQSKSATAVAEVVVGRLALTTDALEGKNAHRETFPTW